VERAIASHPQRSRVVFGLFYVEYHVDVEQIAAHERRYPEFLSGLRLR
tara:strand:+ start:687 stop:830 length:144 start_codon:yes stop_codon:yes gene_type:complete